MSNVATVTQQCLKTPDYNILVSIRLRNANLQESNARSETQVFQMQFEISNVSNLYKFYYQSNLKF